MIPDPQNVFESLQNDVATKLMATAPFNTFKLPDGRAFAVLTEDEGDIQFEFDAMISTLGLSIVVHSPTGDVAQPDIPGPLITKLAFDVWVSEAPIFNRAPLGTQYRLARAMAIVIGTLHLYQAPSINSPIYSNGFTKHRERTFGSERDETGTLIVSRICRFIAPQVAALIT